MLVKGAPGNKNVYLHFLSFLNTEVLQTAVAHYSDAIMSAMATQITVVSIVYSTVCSGADQRKHQSSTSLAFVKGIHRWPVNSPHKEPVTRNMFPFELFLAEDNDPWILNNKLVDAMIAVANVLATQSAMVSAAMVLA